MDKVKVKPTEGQDFKELEVSGGGFVTLGAL